MDTTVRVRFAPSPTGALHIGGVRTALFNYLFAKKNNGVFVLRIEDTDQKRYVEGAEEYIKEALEWCGFPYDEGPGKEGAHAPYRQSERKQLYKRYVQELINKGDAYYAFDSSEALEEHRRLHEKKGETFIYNWHNRLTLENSLSLPRQETEKRLKRGDTYVVRFKSPENDVLVLTDLVRGEISVNTKILDDKILFKSDGMPTYHLANVVDDHLMEITHVIRGEEWLPSLALHYLLYGAFGWTTPQFAHLPLILKPSGNGKLSKRDGEQGGFPIFPLAWRDSAGYRENGYLPEAVVNFLAFLGWNPATDKEVFSMQELVRSFSLDNVNKSGARFDTDKTKWYNQQWLQRKSTTELTTLYRKELHEKGVVFNEETLEKIVGLVRERAVFTKDLWELTHYFFETPNTYNDKAIKKKWKEGTPQLIQQLVEVLHSIENFTNGAIGKVVKDWITSNKLSFGQVMPPLRLLIVGDLKGPDLFDIMALLGKGECLLRIDNGLKVL